jgi:hypothetical protein
VLSLFNHLFYWSRNATKSLWHLVIVQDQRATSFWGKPLPLQIFLQFLFLHSFVYFHKLCGSCNFYDFFTLCDLSTLHSSYKLRVIFTFNFLESFASSISFFILFIHMFCNCAILTICSSPTHNDFLECFVILHTTYAWWFFWAFYNLEHMLLYFVVCMLSPTFTTSVYHFFVVSIVFFIVCVFVKCVHSRLFF